MLTSKLNGVLGDFYIVLFLIGRSNNERKALTVGVNDTFSISPGPVDLQVLFLIRNLGNATSLLSLVSELFFNERPL